MPIEGYPYKGVQGFVLLPRAPEVLELLLLLEEA